MGPPFQILKSYLKDYIQAEALNALTLSINGGEFKLSNLAVRPEALDELVGDMPFRLKHGVIGSVSLHIPGGLSGILSNRIASEPVRLVIDNVHLLVDRVEQSPRDVAAKRAEAKQSALDRDTATYRQMILDRLLSDTSAGTTQGGTPTPGGGWIGARIDAVLRNVCIEVKGFHLRYEDKQSQVDAPFAAGVTFASFFTQGDALGPFNTAGGLWRRAARLVRLAFYLDPLSRHGSFSDMDTAGRAVAFANGISFESESAVVLEPLRPLHNFVVEPTSPALTLSYNAGARVAGAPLLSAELSLNVLRIAMSQRQYHAALFLQSWMDEDAHKRWLEALRAQHRPRLSLAAARASGKLAQWRREWFTYICILLRELQRRRVDPGIPRWDNARVRGSLARRSRYLAAYARQLKAETEAIRKAVGRGAAAAGADVAAIDLDKVGDAATIKECRELESELLTEQLLEYRAEVRLDAEAAAEGAASLKAATDTTKGAARLSGGGNWLSWMTRGASSPALAVPSPKATAEVAIAATPKPDRAEALRARFEEAKRGSGAGTVRLELTASLESASLALERIPGNPVLSVQAGGAAKLTQFTSGAWAVRVSLQDARAIDGVTQGTAYPTIMQPLTAAADAPVGHDSVAVQAPPPPPLLEIVAEARPQSAPDIDFKFVVASQPLLVVFAPRCMRAVLSFFSFPAAEALGSAVAAGISAISTRTSADVYAVLAQHSRVALSATIAGPTIILPEDVTDVTARRLVLYLGNVELNSAPDVKDLIQPPAARPDFEVESNSVNGVKPVSIVEDASAYDSWRLHIADVGATMQDKPRSFARHEIPTASVFSTSAAMWPAEDASDYALTSRAPRAQAVIEPVALNLELQTAVLPETSAPNRLRIRGHLPRLAVRVSLPFALSAGVLRKQLFEMLEGVASDRNALAREFAASVAAAKTLIPAAALTPMSPLVPTAHPGIASPTTVVSPVVAKPRLSAGVGPHRGTSTKPTIKEHAGALSSTTLPKSRASAAAPMKQSASGNESPIAFPVASPKKPTVAPSLSRSPREMKSPASLIASESPVAPASKCVIVLRFDELRVALCDVRRSALCMKRVHRRAVRESDTNDVASASSGDETDADIEGSDDEEEDEGDDMFTSGPNSSRNDEEIVIQVSSLNAGMLVSTRDAAISLELRALDVIDGYQRAGAAFQYLLTSNSERHSAGNGPSPYDTAPSVLVAERTDITTGVSEGIPLIYIALQQHTSPPTGVPPLALNVAFTTLHVGYNPETIAAVQLYVAYLQHCALGGDVEVDAAPTPSPAIALPHPAGVITGAGVTGAAAPSVTDAAAMFSSVLRGLIDEDTLEGSVNDAVANSSTPASGTIAEPRAALVEAKEAKPSMRVTASLARLTLAMHKEREARCVAIIGVVGLGIDVGMRSDGALAVSASLADIYLRDTGTQGTLFPLLISHVRSHEIHAVPVANSRAIASHVASTLEPLIRVVFCSYPKGSSEAVAADSEVKVEMAPLRIVYWRLAFDEVIDYLLTGILGTLVTSAVESAGAALAATAASASRVALDISASRPHVLLPSSTSSPDTLVAALRSLHILNSFISDSLAPPETDPTLAVIDNLHISVDGIEISAILTSKMSIGPQHLTLGDSLPSVSVTIARPLNASAYRRRDNVGLDLSVRVPNGAVLRAARAHYTLLMKVLSNNFGGTPYDSAAASTVVHQRNVNRRGSVTARPSSISSGPRHPVAVSHGVLTTVPEGGRHNMDDAPVVAITYAAAGHTAAVHDAPTMLVSVVIDGEVSLGLFGDGDLTPSASQRGNSAFGAQLAALLVSQVELSYTARGDATSVLAANIASLRVRDMRDGVPEILRGVLQPRCSVPVTTAFAQQSSHASSDTSISLVMKTEANGDSEIDVGIGAVDIVVMPTFVERLLWFASRDSGSPMAADPKTDGASLQQTSTVPQRRLSRSTNDDAVSAVATLTIRSRRGSVRSVVSGRRSGRSTPRAPLIDASQPTSVISRAAASRFSLRAGLRGVSIIVPVLEPSGTANVWLVARLQADVNYVADGRGEAADKLASSSPAVLRNTDARGTAESIWVALLPVGRFEAPIFTGVPDGAGTFLLKPTNFTVSAVIAVSPEISLSTSIVEGELHTRAVTMTAGALDVTLSHTFAHAALRILNDVTASGLLGNAPATTSSLQPTALDGSSATDKLDVAAAYVPLPSHTDAAPLSTVTVTVVDRVRLDWLGLRLTVLDDENSDAPNAGAQQASSPEVEIKMPRGLITFAVQDVAVTYERDRSGRQAVTSSFSFALDAWDSRTWIWRPVILQPWPFRLVVAMAAAADCAGVPTHATSEIKDPAAVVSLDIGAVGPLAVLLNDGTLAAVRGGVGRWLAVTSRLTSAASGTSNIESLPCTTTVASQTNASAAATFPTWEPPLATAPRVVRLLRRRDFRIIVQVPLVVVELAMESTNASTRASELTPFLRAVLVDAEFAVRSDSIVTADDALTTLATEMVLGVRATELHLFDLSDIGAELSGGLLATSTPACRATVTETAAIASLARRDTLVHVQAWQRRRPSATGDVTVTPLPPDGARGSNAASATLIPPVRLVDIEVRTVSRLHADSAPLPCPDVERQLGRTPSAVSVTFDTLHVEWNAATVATVMRFAGSISAPSTDAVEAVSPSTVTAVEALQLSPPASLVSPSVRESFRLIAHMRSVSMSLNGYSVRAPHLATLAMRRIIVGVLVLDEDAPGRQNGGTEVRGSIGELSVVDGVNAGSCYPYVLGADGGTDTVNESRSPYDVLGGYPAPKVVAATGINSSVGADVDAADAVARFAILMFGAGCDVAAGTVVSAAVRPIRLVYSHAIIMALVDFLSTRLVADASASSAGHHGSPDATSCIALQRAHVHAAMKRFTTLQDIAHATRASGTAEAIVHPQLLTSLNITIASPHIVVPTTSFSTTGALDIRLASVELSTMVKSAATARNGDAKGYGEVEISASSHDTGAHRKMYELPATAPVSVLRIALAGLTIGAPTGAVAMSQAIMPALSAPIVVSYTTYLDPHVAAHSGAEIDVHVPHTALTFRREGFTALRGVLDMNIAAPPLTTASLRESCIAEVQLLPPAAVLATPTDVSNASSAPCSVCGTNFGCALCANATNSFPAFFARRTCGVCLSVVCPACVSGRVYDAESATAVLACVRCVRSMSVGGTVASFRRISNSTAARVIADEAPLSLHVTLPSLQVTLLDDTTPLATLTLERTDVHYSTAPSHSVSMRVEVEIGALAITDDSPGSETWVCRVLVAPTGTLNNSADHHRRRRSSTASSSSAAPVQLHVGYTIDSGGNSRVNVVLHGCDINPERTALIAIADFFSSYAKVERMAESTTSADVVIIPASTASALPPPMRRLPVARMQVDVHLARPRILLLRAPSQHNTDMFIASLIGQIRLRLDAENVRSVLLTGIDAGAAAAVSAPSDGTVSPILRGRMQDKVTSAQLHLLEIEVYRTRFRAGGTASAIFEQAPATGASHGASAAPLTTSAARPPSSTVTVPSFHVLPGPRLHLLRPFDVHLDVYVTETNLLPLPSRYAVPAAAVPVDIARCVAVRRPPRGRTIASLQLPSPIHATVSFLDALIGLGVLARYGEAVAAVPHASDAEFVHPMQPPIPTVETDLPTSFYDSVLPRPSGWHPDDYEVLLPDGIQAGLVIREASFGDAAGRGDGDVLTIDVVEDIVLDVSMAAAAAPVYDMGDGMRPQTRTPMGALRVARDVDILIAANGIPLLGRSRTEAIDIIRSIVGPRRLRLRAIPLSATLTLASGVRATLVNNLAGLDADVVRLEIGHMETKVAGYPSATLSEVVYDDELAPTSPSAAMPVPPLRCPALSSWYATMSLRGFSFQVWSPAVLLPQPLIEPFDVSITAAMMDRREGGNASSSIGATLATTASATSRPLAVRRPAAVMSLRTGAVELVAAHRYVASIRAAQTAWADAQEAMRIGSVSTHSSYDSAGVALTDEHVITPSNATRRTDRIDDDLAHVADDAMLLTPEDSNAAVAQAARGSATSAVKPLTVFLATVAPPSRFPFSVRNETGSRVVVGVRGLSSDGVAMFSQPLAIDEGASFHIKVEPIGTTRDATSEAETRLADTAAQRGAVILEAGYEIGVAFARNRDSFGLREESGDVGPRTSLRQRGRRAAVIHFVGSPSKVEVDLEHEARREHAVIITPIAGFGGFAPSPVPTPVYSQVALAEGRRTVTLRSAVQVYNATGTPLEVFAQLSVSHGSSHDVSMKRSDGADGPGTDTSHEGRRLIGIVQPRTWLAVPLLLCSAHGLRLRPVGPAVPGGGGHAGFAPSETLAITRALTAPVELACFAAPPPAVAATGEGHAAPATAFRLTAHVSQRGLGSGDAVLRVVVHAPLRLHNRLPVPLRLRLENPSLSGSETGTLLLQPGQGVDVHSISSGVAARGAGSLGPAPAPHMRIASEGFAWTHARQLTLRYGSVSAEDEEETLFSATAAGSSASVRLSVRALPPDTHLAPTQHVVAISAAFWIVNLTGLPLVYGARVNDSDVVATGAQAATVQLADECFENQRFYGPLLGWKDPLPTERGHWTDDAGKQTIRREDLDRALPRGWSWVGDWEQGQWDHAHSFNHFVDNGSSRRVPVTEKRMTDNVRRRKWFRVRQLTATAGGSTSDSALAAAGISGLPPGIRVSVARPKEPGTPATPSRFVTGSVIGAAGTSDPRHVVMFTPRDSRTLYVRFGGGAWSSVALAGDSGHDLVTDGAVPIDVSGPRIRSASLEGGSIDTIYPLLVTLEEAHSPFPETRVIKLQPRHVLVNATSQPLYYRQAGRRSGDALSEFELPPYSHGPVWWHDPTSFTRAAAAVLLSPAAARGGWSPPVVLALPGDAKASGTEVPLSVTMPEVPSYVRTRLGVTPLGALVLGVSVRPNTDVGAGASLVVVTQQTRSIAPLRPAIDALDGPPRERQLASNAFATDQDLLATAEARMRATSASSPQRSIDDEFIAQPLIQVDNYSRCIFAYHQKKPHVYDANGQRMTDDDADKACRDVRAQRSSARSYGGPDRDTAASSPLGALYASAVHYVSPGALGVTVGLVDAAAGMRVSLTVAVMDPRVPAPGESRILSLHELDRPRVLLAPNGVGVITQVVAAGRGLRIVVIDDTRLRGRVGELLSGSMNGRPRGSSWELLDSAVEESGGVRELEEAAIETIDAAEAARISMTGAHRSTVSARRRHTTREVWDASLTIAFGSIGLSLIDQRPVDVMYARLTDIQLKVVAGRRGFKYSLTIGDGEVDDMAEDAAFPVVVARSRAKASAARGADIADATRPFLTVRCDVGKQTQRSNSQLSHTVTQRSVVARQALPHVIALHATICPLRIAVSLIFADRINRVQSSFATTAAGGTTSTASDAMTARACGVDSPALGLQTLAHMTRDATFAALERVVRSTAVASEAALASRVAWVAASASIPLEASPDKYLRRGSLGRPPTGIVVGSAALAHRDPRILIETLVEHAGTASSDGGASAGGAARVDQLVVHPLDLTMSFTRGTGAFDIDAGSADLPVGPVILALMRGFAISDAHVSLSLPQHTGGVLDVATYTAIATTQVSQRALAQIPSLLAAVNIAGLRNPYAVLREVGGGVASGFDRAAAGLQAGDALGAAMGAGSVISSTFGTLAGTASGVTGFVSDTLNSISGSGASASGGKDAAPGGGVGAGSVGGAAGSRPAANVMSGVSQGAFAFANGVLGGVTGLVTKPMDGFMSGGMRAGFRGIGQGLIGVVAQPVAGLAGGVSKVLQGVEGTLQSRDVTATLAAEQVPIRCARAFYGVTAAISTYDARDAAVQKRLQHMTSLGDIGPLIGCGDLLEGSGGVLVATTKSVFTLRRDDVHDEVRPVSLRNVHAITSTGTLLEVRASAGTGGSSTTIGWRLTHAADAERLALLLELARRDVLDAQ